LSLSKPEIEFQKRDDTILQDSRRTAGVSGFWAGVDSAWEQEKLEARKMLENAAESHTSGAEVDKTL